MLRGRGGSHRRYRPEGAMSTCNLPNDIIADILSRLPVKPLLRFRCVCKPWRTLLSNPNFISFQLHRTKTLNNDDDDTLLVHSCHNACSNQLISLLHIKNPDFAPNLEHPFPPHSLFRPDMEIVGFINGLVLLSSPPLSPLITLWNPATKRYKYIRYPKITNFTIDVLDKVSIGFAFDSVGNDYKITRLVCFKSESGIPNQAEVYSANSGTWREIGVDLRLYIWETECAVVVKGVPYWIVDPSMEVALLGYRSFLWFDARSEVFKQLPMTGIGTSHNTRLRTVNFRDSLAVLVYSAASVPLDLTGFAGAYYWPVEDSNKCVDVWVMEDSDGVSSWSKKFTFGPILGVEHLIGCSKNGKILVENTEGVLVLYDPDTKEVKNVPINGARAGSFDVCSYSASLLPIQESVQVGKLDEKFVVRQLDKMFRQFRRNRYR